MDTISADKIKICPLCNTPFTCSTNNCWCSKLPAVMPLHPGSECYCPQCLNAIINEKINKEN